MCCSPHDTLTNYQLVVLTNDGESRIVYSGRRVLGYLVDSSGCVVLFESDLTDTRLYLLSLGTQVKTRTLQLCDSKDSRRTVRRRPFRLQHTVLPNFGTDKPPHLLADRTAIGIIHTRIVSLSLCLSVTLCSVALRLEKLYRRISSSGLLIYFFRHF